MLSEEVREEIRAELEHYEISRAACVEGLKIVQRHHGWVSDEHLAEVADLLDMTVDELDNVATFYNLIFRRQVGEHVILLCDSVSCWLMGYENLHDRLKGKLGIDLGETSKDGKFTLLPMVCLGACDHAPAMMIDDRLYRDLDVDQLDRILESLQGGSD
jgi:NADH-quinone oxidoreductase subunit E